MTVSLQFHDRTDAGQQLARHFEGRGFRCPLVLAIPRGGVVTGYALAHELDAELDVVLSRKLRAPYQPEFALGAISEDGQVTLNSRAVALTDASDEYLAAEKKHQMAEINRRKKIFRAARPVASISGRTVIVTDDGIATGSTIAAALQVVRSKDPYELIAAVPVAAPDRLEPIAHLCDEIACLLTPEDFYAVGQFYERFDEVEDDEVVDLLREAYSAEPNNRNNFRNVENK